MNDGACAACGEPTVFEEDLGSAICTSCGTLSNPSQNILDSHLEHIDSSGRDYQPQSIPIAGGNTLKGRDGRSLAGQDKEARDRRNTIAMHDFINAISSRLSHPGSALRAQTIFDQAMSKGKFRWGKKAKRIAGASIAIALREASKNVSLRDIAFLMEEPVISLARFFSGVCVLLQLKLTLFEPTQHLPSLESHLTMLIQTPKESSLPNPLVTTLIPLLPRLPAVRNTVTSLATLVARVDDLANLPTAPSACALFILALEGELSASLPNAGALAQALGVRLSVSKAVVMQRYKVIYDLVEEYIKEVPWLDAYEQKAGNKSRPKVAKRVVVAKGLKDVVQFQDDIWRRKFAGSENPVLILETDTDDDDETSTEGSVYSFGTASSVASGSTDYPRTVKRRKTRHDRHVAEASRFLLQSRFDVSGSATSEAGRDLVHHLLTTDNAAFTRAFTRPPTRLQILTNVRGGEHAIGDDELFDDGELDSFLRTSEEVDALRRTVDWDEGPKGAAGPLKKRKRPAGDAGEDTSADTPRTQRINMDVLARLLDPSTITGEDDLDFVMPEDYEDGESIVDDSDCPVLGPLADGEEIVEEWRPMSPGGAGYDDDRYDL